MRDADAHKAHAAEAATAAKRYAGEYQTQMKEAQVHGDRHKELWREAEMYAPPAMQALHNAAYQAISCCCNHLVQAIHSDTGWSG